MTSRRLRRFLKDKKGASAIEFAFVIGPFLLIIFGTIEFGRLMWTREALRETALSAARCMGVLETSCKQNGSFNASDTTTYAQNLALGWSIVLPASDVSLNPSATCGGVGGFSQVTVSYTFQTAVPLLIGALANGVPISASACFPNQS